MTSTRSDPTWLEEIRNRLYTPVVGDVLDTLGFQRQFLPPPIRPLREQMRLAGRAMPVLIAEVYGKQESPFGRLTEALDQLQPGEVYICGGTLRCASWGEILTATAKMRGAVGAVIDGYHRDTPQVLEQNWPVFSRGGYAQDAAVRSQVVSYRCPIEIQGVRIEPGDLVFGDIDGVVIVPREVEDEAIRAAFQKAQSEKLVRKAIESGMSSTDAFHRYGVL